MPTTAYFAFSKENRPVIKESLLSKGFKAGVPEISRALADKWKSLSPDEKKVYEDKAAAENAAVENEKDSTDDVIDSNNNQFKPTGLSFPVSNIRKVINCDPNIERLTQTAILSLSAATEKFIEYLAQESCIVVSQNKRQVIRAADLSEVCRKKARLNQIGFQDAIGSLTSTASKSSNTVSSGSSKSKPNTKPDKGGHPGILSYFKVQN